MEINKLNSVDVSEPLSEQSNNLVGAKPTSPSVLIGADMDADLSQDKAFQAYRRGGGYTGIKPVFFAVDQTEEAPVGNSTGISFREHDQRGFEIGHQAFDKKFDQLGRIGKKFALNSTTSERVLRSTAKAREKGSVRPDGYSLGDISSYLKEYNIPDVGSVFADTVETSTDRLFSKDGVVTNRAIQLDNYQHCLNTIPEMKLAIAKALIAKMDADRNVSESFGSLLDENGQLNTTKDPQVVYAELKNRLRNNSLEHREEYQTIIKLFGELDKLENENNRYKQMRQSVGLDILNKVSSPKFIPEKDDGTFFDDPLGVAEELEYAMYLGNKHGVSPVDGTGSGKTLGAFISELVGDNNGDKGTLPDGEKDRILRLSDLVEQSKLLEGKDVAELQSEINTYFSSRDRFIQNSNASIISATSSIDTLSYYSPYFPSATLAGIVDPDYFEQSHGKALEDGKIISASKDEVKKALRDAVADSLPSASEEQVEAIVSNMETILKENKSSIEAIYNPERDTQNPQRKYLPFDSKDYDDYAQNIMRDALALAIFKSEEDRRAGLDEAHENIFDEYYTKENIKDVILSSLDETVQKEKPDLDRVTDLYNVVLLISQSASAQIDDKTVAELVDSQFMKDNQLFTNEELHHIKDFTSGLAEGAEQMKDQDIYGNMDAEEIREDIQEKLYLKYANQEVARLYTGLGTGLDDKVGAVAKSKQIASNLFANFMQNNQILRNLDVCMEGARNPTTTLETVSSLSKACLEKFRDEHQEKAKKMQETMSNQQSAMLGMDIFGALVIFQGIMSGYEHAKSEVLLANINEELNRENTYVQSATDELQRASRKMAVDAEHNGFGNHIVREGFENKIIDETEAEQTVRDIVFSSSKDLPDHLELLSREVMREALEEISSVDNDEAIALTRLIEEEKERIEALKEEEKERIRAVVLSDTIGTIISEKQIALEKLEEELRQAVDKKDFDTAKELNVEVDTIKEELLELKTEVEKRVDELIVTNDGKSVDEISLAIRSKIEKSEKLIKESEERLAQITIDVKTMKERLENSSTGVLFDLDRLDMSEEKFEDNFKELTVEEKLEIKKQIAQERNETMLALGKYRDLCYLTLIDSMDEEERLRAQKDIDQIDAVMPRLHRASLADSINISDVAIEHLENTYHIKIGKELKQKMMYEGMSADVVAKINEASLHLQQHQREKMQTELIRVRRAQETLSLEKPSIDSGASSSLLSGLMRSFVKSKSNNTGDIIKDTNACYVTNSVAKDGMVAVVMGKGYKGMLLHEMKMAQKNKDDARFSLVLGKLEKLQEQGFIPRDQMDDILSAMSKDANKQNMQAIQSFVSNYTLTKKRGSKEHEKGKSLRSSKMKV